MGGKSPFIILDDAKIDDNLIEHAVTSAFWNGGQNCSANMRQIVDKKVKDDFLQKVLEKTKTLKVGKPLDPQTDMGSMVSEEHLNRVNGYINKGIDENVRFFTASYNDSTVYIKSRFSGSRFNQLNFKMNIDYP